MRIKRIISLVLAVITVMSCVALTGCKKDNGNNLRLEKRTAVYSAEKLDYSIDSSINSVYVNGDMLYLSYGETYTVVRNENGEEVERFKGYYYQYNGSYEPDDGFVLYANDVVYGTNEFEETGTISDNADSEGDGFYGPAEINDTEAVNENTDSVNDGFYGPAEMPDTISVPENIGAEDIAIEEPAQIIAPVPTPSDDSGEFVIEGEPDEYGVITDEYNNIQVPEGWWVDYDFNDVMDKFNLKSGEKERLNIDIYEISGIDSTNSYIVCFTVNNDGNFVYLLQTWAYDDETMEESTDSYLVTVDSNTIETLSIVNMKDAFKSFGDIIDLQYLYVNDIEYTNDNHIILNIGGDYYITDEKFENVKTVSGEDKNIDNVITSEDTVYVTYYDQSWINRNLGKLVNGTIEPITSETFTEMGNKYYNIIGGVNSKIYMRGSTGVAYYDIETDTVVEELNYLNSDIKTDDVNSISLIEDGKMIMVSTAWDVGVGETSVYLLTKVPEEDLKEEVIIKIAALYNNYQLANAAIAFNKLNTGVRVSIVTYDQYNNEENEWTGAATQLNGEIISGNLPDIVLLDSSLPTENYFHKGVFEDLNKYINDEENGINRADYLENIFKAGEVDGKLYSAILSFTVSTLAAKSKFVGAEQGWTFAEFIDAISKMPEGMELMFGSSRNEVLRYIVQQGMSIFVDWNTGKTLFDSPEFVKFIEYLKTLPEKGMWEQYYADMGDEWVYDEEAERRLGEKYTLQYWNDYGLLRNTTLYSFNDILYMYNDFASRDVTMIGYPTSEGNGAIIVPETELAISSKSPVKDQAWTFIKYLLENGTNDYCFPTKYSLLEEKRKSDTEGSDWGKGGIYYGYNDYEWMKENGYSEDYINYTMNSNNVYDDAMGEEVMKLIENASIIMRYDDELNEIITEELSSFFGGTRSAEDTARVIAGRASILISEKS